ncbi:MAG: XDD4 family exosortase-dependent surface protein [Planctomycetota bacterium]
MFIHRCLVVAVVALGISAPARASFVVTYTVDASGRNDQPLNGLSASAEFSINGTQLTITLSNTSTGVPAVADVSDSLLVSLAFELLDGITIVSGNSAAIAAGSVGLGQWGGQGADFDVGDEWAWTNDGGGDLLEFFPQVITTSQGAGGGSTTSFQGVPDPKVNGPFGGIAASPPLLAVPDSQYAVSDSIEFNLTLSGTLSESQLATIAQWSIVEFGSDYQYLAVPAPGTLWLLAFAAAGRRRRRWRRPV